MKKLPALMVLLAVCAAASVQARQISMTMARLLVYPPRDEFDPAKAPPAPDYAQARSCPAANTTITITSSLT